MLLSLEAADKLIGLSLGSALKHKSLIETLFSVSTAFMNTENRHADRPGGGEDANYSSISRVEFPATDTCIIILRGHPHKTNRVNYKVN